MSRIFDKDDARDEIRGERRSELSELIDMLGRRISGAILFAGVAIGLGVYAGGGSEVEAVDYQSFAADGEVFRLNTDSGSIIACNATRCMQVLRPGQDLAEDQGTTLFKTPAGALPAPAASPTQQPAQPALPAPTAQPAQTK